METQVVKPDPAYLVIGIPLKPLYTTAALLAGYYVGKKVILPRVRQAQP